MSTNNFNGEWTSKNIHTERENKEAIESLKAFFYVIGWLLLIVIAIPYWVLEKLLKASKEFVLEAEYELKELKNDRKSVKELFQGLVGGILGSVTFWVVTTAIIIIH